MAHIFPPRAVEVQTGRLGPPFKRGGNNARRYSSSGDITFNPLTDSKLGLACLTLTTTQ